MIIPHRALAIPTLVAAALMLAAQLVLAGMPAAETTLELIRLSPDAWSAAHILIAGALVLFVIGGVALLRLEGATPVGAVAFAVLTTGAIVAAMTNGIDAVLGVLSGINADGSTHQAIAENLVQPLDIWDAALTFGLVALVARVHTRGAVPWWGTAAALIGLAVPAFSDLRVIAAAAVLLGFALLAASAFFAPQKGPFWTTVAIVVAFVLAAFFSVERVALLVVVAAILLAARQAKNRKLAPL